MKNIKISSFFIFSLSILMRCGYADTIWPDVSGPCAAGLQACINSVDANETILILGSGNSEGGRNAYNIITEDISIDKPLTLTGSESVDVVFFTNRHISIALTSAGTSGNRVTIQRLKLLQGSIDIVDQYTSGLIHPVYDINHVQILGVNATLTADVTCAINVRKMPPITGSSPTGSAFHFRDNVIDFQSDGADFGGICFTPPYDGLGLVSANDGIIIERNRISRRMIAPGPFYDFGTFNNFGIRIDLSATANGSGGSDADSVRIIGNTVIGPFAVGIFSMAWQYGDTTVAMDLINNFVNAQVGRSGAIVVIDYNSTVAFNLINNTLTDNAQAIYLEKAGDFGTAGGIVDNNLLAYNAASVYVSGPMLLANSHNLFFSTGAAVGFTPGSSTLTSDPLLESHTFPALHSATMLGDATSPAIDAGLSSALPSYAVWDAAGEQRVVGTGVDIGAFEKTFDLAQIVDARGDNVVRNVVRIDSSGSAAALRDQEYIVVTPVVSNPSLRAQTARTLGIFQYTSSFPAYWGVFNENGLDMSVGQKFSVLIPWGNASIAPFFATGKYGFRHTSHYATDTMADAFTPVIESHLTGHANAVAATVGRYENPPASAPLVSYHDHRLGLEYGAQPGPFSTTYIWRLINQDNSAMSPMPDTAKSFNVVVAPLDSPNAFTRNVGVGPFDEIRLDHPLINDNPCAAITVGRNNTSDPSPPFTYNNVAFALQYRTAGAGGHWYIVPVSDPAFPAGAGFNVIIDGTQASRCLAQLYPDRIFVYGFD